MQIIGLTGGIASGKSTVTKLLREKGYIVIDADELARDVVEPGGFGALGLKACFGPAIFSGGILDRKKLREEIFKAAHNRRVVERILHPLIQLKSDTHFRILEQQGQKIVFYDAPLLYEAKQEHRFHKMVVVSAGEKTQIDRVMKRDKISREEAQKILQAQMPLEEKKAKAHFIVENNSTENELRKEVDRMLDYCLK